MLQPKHIDGVLDFCVPEEGKVALPALFDSPHSGSKLPPREEFQYACSRESVLCSTDHYVDEFFEDCIEHGIPFLSAIFPRSFVDLNRQKFNLLPSHIRGGWSTNKAPQTVYSKQVMHGLGSIFMQTGRNAEEQIYKYNRRPTQAQAIRRLNKYWQPYHDTLSGALDTLEDKFGFYHHVNCHSMPESQNNLPTFCLGNKEGRSCGTDLTMFLSHFLRDHPISVRNNWSVYINAPYSGAYIVERYGAPYKNRHSIQLEILRSAYMNEETRQKHAGFEDMKALMSDVTKAVARFTWERILQIGPNFFDDLEPAAE